MTNTAKSTKPLPVAAKFKKVATGFRYTAGADRPTTFGFVAVIHLSDGTRRRCEGHTHRDEQGSAIRKCAQKMIDAINAEAKENS